MTMKIAKGFTMDPDYLAGRSIALLGKKGSGKSFGMRVLAEEFYEAGVQTVIIDPVGVFWGLRSSHDGRRKGLPIPVFGGSYGDSPLEHTAGELMADLAVTEGLSMILDLSTFTSRNQERQFAMAFLDRLYRSNKERNLIHVMVDEADLFCMTEDTEILTDAGWARWDKVTPGVRAVTFDPETSEYAYGKVSRVIVREHDGEMVHLKTKGLDCLVTPDHRVLLQRTQRSPGRYDPTGYPWTFVKAAEVPQQVHIPSGGAPTGPGVTGLDNETLRILGWIISDGYWHDRTKSTSLCIQQSLGTTKGGVRIAHEMDSVLSALPGVSRYDREPRSHYRASDGRTISGTASWCWYINSAQADRLHQWLDEDIHQIPRALLENCSRNQLLALFQGLMEGDGTFRDGRWERFFPGKNETLADSFQELVLRLGINAYKTWVPQIEQWHVILNERSGRHYVRKPQRAQYAGLVWDITVPTGAFVARRNGKVFVTGNCPQRPRPQDAPLLAIMENLVRRGRNFGIGTTLATQRPAVLSKDVLTQVDALVALRMTGPQDRDAIKSWVSGQGDDEAWATVAPSLPGLANGEAWWWVPEKQVLERVQMRQTRTFDSSPTRTRGAQARAPKEIADVDLSAIASQIAATVERAKANDPKELRKQVKDLLDRLDRAERDLSQARDASEPQVRTVVETKVVTQTVEPEGLREALLAARRRVSDLSDALDDVEALLDEVRAQAPQEEVSVSDPAPPRRSRAVTPAPSPVPQDRPTTAVEATDDVQVSPARQRLLEALYGLESIGITAPHKTQLALWTGVSPKSSGYANNLGGLRSQGLIDYPSPSMVGLTQQGRGLVSASAVPDIPDDRALHEHIRSLVSPARWRLLSVLIEEFPNHISREDLAERAGVSAASSGFANNLGALRSLGLLDYPSPRLVLASDLMFLDAP